MNRISLFSISLLILSAMLSSCNSPVSTKDRAPANSTAVNAPEYFNLRPELEKDYGYMQSG